MNPLSMVEAKDIADASGDEKEISSFMKRFIKIDIKDAKKLRKEIEDLGLMKMKEEHVAKIIDMLPEDAADVNKIFADISLDEDETSKILEVVKKYR